MSELDTMGSTLLERDIYIIFCRYTPYSAGYSGKESGRPGKQWLLLSHS